MKPSFNQTTLLGIADFQAANSRLATRATPAGSFCGLIDGERQLALLLLEKLVQRAKPCAHQVPMKVTELDVKHMLVAQNLPELGDDLLALVFVQCNFNGFHSSIYC